MSARRRSQEPPPIQPKVFQSVDEIDHAITLLRRRVDQLRVLEPIETRFDDQGVRNAQNDISNTILEIFGTHSPEYDQHKNHSLRYGPLRLNMTDDEFQEQFVDGHPKSMMMLEGLIARLEEKKVDHTPTTNAQKKPTGGNAVFLVHGHAEVWKDKIARFLQKLDLVPIILDEQPDRGRTIIQKFEDHAEEAGFAVVLLTGDDIGGEKGFPASDLKPRARQNVIYELGFFRGHLGARHVCALYEDGVELPSDLSGVLYKPLSTDWELPLAKEIADAGLSVDLNKLL